MKSKKEPPTVWITLDSTVSIGNFVAESAGTNALYSSGAGLGVDMDFSVFVDLLSMLFGKHDPTFSDDRAGLTVFNGAAQVGQTVLLYNKNNVMDQTISVSGVGLFDRANLVFVDPTGGSNSALAEVIDNVTFNTAAAAVPEPATMLLISLGLAGAGFARRRQNA